MAGRMGHLSPDEGVEKQIALWWQEADAAVRTNQMPRARRFLRWILSSCPEDEEAWLWLARLAPSQEERLSCLRRAYAFHQDSSRVQAALRLARKEQLESWVGDLRAGGSSSTCLPDRRYNCDGDAPCQKTDSRSLTHASITALESQAGPRPGLAALSRTDLAAWGAFLIPLLVYLLTTCSTVYNLDSAEFSAAVHALGIVRATGYPLYLLLGKVFTVLLPVGDIGFRLNVMSAVCAAGTVALLYRLLLRLTQQRAASLAASLLFAFSYYFWSQAVIAEVYTLHTLFMAALLVLLLRWQATRSDELLAVIGLVLGLSFGNHMSTILLIPGAGVFLLIVAGKELLHPKRIFLLAAPFVLGLGIYAYLPLRYLAQPEFNYAGYYDASGHFVPLDMTRVENIWWLVSGQGFQQLMFDYAPTELVDEVREVALHLWGSFLGIGLLPGVLGIWVQVRRRPKHFILFGLIFVANLVFFASYRVIDKSVMFIPVFLIWAVWIGEGYAWLIRWVQGWRKVERPRSPVWTWGLTALAVMVLAVNWSLVDVRTDTRARDRAEAILSSAGSDAIVFGWWASAPPMHYLQVVEDQRSDVLVINRFLIGAEDMYSLIDNSLGQRPVYAVELDEGLVGAYNVVSVGPMFELTPREMAGTERKK